MPRAPTAARCRRASAQMPAAPKCRTSPSSAVRCRRNLRVRRSHAAWRRPQCQAKAALLISRSTALHRLRRFQGQGHRLRPLDGLSDRVRRRRQGGRDAQDAGAAPAPRLPNAPRYRGQPVESPAWIACVDRLSEPCCMYAGEDADSRGAQGGASQGGWTLRRLLRDAQAQQRAVDD